MFVSDTGSSFKRVDGTVHEYVSNSERYETLNSRHSFGCINQTEE